MATFAKSGLVITITLTAQENTIVSFIQQKYGALQIQDFFSRWMQWATDARRTSQMESRFSAYENASPAVRTQVDTLLGVSD